MTDQLNEAARLSHEAWLETKRRAVRAEQMSASEIDEALALVVELAFQNTTDRYDNPREFSRQSRAIKLVKDTFLRKGGD